MARAKSNGIEIEYETFGAKDADPLLLVMGLGGQMVLWDEGFCRLLADRGFHVIRFDNRDVGKSTHMDASGVPDVMTLIAASNGSLALKPAYTLSDMAADSVGLLDALQIESAHVVGASMGGMISQTIALEHPARVKTLTSIMSTTGDPSLPPPAPEALAFLVTPSPADREGAIQHGVEMFRAIGSTGFEFEEAHIRKLATLQYERGFNPGGVLRQLAAILASGSRKQHLARLSVPTLVIHGKVDPLIPVECGVDTAASIPGARLELVDGMGHDMPIVLWPRLVEWIAGHASRSAHAAA
jgi:pimeloyl-ACP methyl ester carboxylesterase